MTNPHGAEVLKSGYVRFHLWAPACEHIELCLSDRPDPIPMNASDGGWHYLITSLAHAGSRYRFRLPRGRYVPDPASRYQPEDVHGPSEVIDMSEWPARNEWRGRPWHEAVVYELHIGAFTPEGTFQAAIARLDDLSELGITALEIMPVGDFPGRWNWGYDGVLPYATDSSYGTPEDFKELIEAAHQRGIMVILDVVYNHFGPEGNYLGLYAPDFFTDRHRTPWGPAINFDGPCSRPVRDFFVHNAIFWLRYYHLDGLRLDAVHAIRDESPTHILDELAATVRSTLRGRHIHLILENEENQARLLERDEQLRPALYTAQWNDDVHHALHTAITGEGQGYYSEYRGDTSKLGRALAEGFAFQGEHMQYRGSPRGEPSSHIVPEAFIAFLQNHDQIGNRAFGERISRLASAEAMRSAAAIYLLLPQIPMLFMGEEWGSLSPFPFFSDFGGDLGEAVREGRRREFAKFPEFQDPARREQIPDPQSEATFASAKVGDWASEPASRDWIAWYRRVLRCRKSNLPILTSVEHGGTFEVIGAAAVVVRWSAAASRRLVLAANLSSTPAETFPCVPASPFWLEGTAHEHGLGPWTVAWWVEDVR